MLDRTAPRFRVLQCRSCGLRQAEPRELCSACAGGLDAITVEGRGSLVSWTVVRRPPDGFREHGPYCVGVIDLDAGVRVTSRLKGLVQPDGPSVRVVLGAGDSHLPTFQVVPPE